MIPKVFEPLKFYCTFANQKSTESGVAPAPGWVGGWVGGGARGGGGGGAARHRCNINFSNGQSIGIVLLYGMCSHSLYIKGEN